MAQKKKLILCDSNILFDYFNKVQPVVAELDTIGFDRLLLSSISVGEAYYGMFKKETRQTKELINRFNIVHVDKAISEHFVSLLYEHGQSLSIPDGLIAATALELNVELYTLNVKDFDFLKGLKLYKPKAFKLKNK